MLDETTKRMFNTDAALHAAYVRIVELERELATALHNATYMTAKVAGIDMERLVLLDERDDLRNHFDAAVRRGDQFLVELDAARAALSELRDVADAPGEDIRATIDAYFAKEYDNAMQ